MDQAVSHRPLTVDAQVHTQVSPCGIYGWQKSLRSSVFSYQYDITMAPYLYRVIQNSCTILMQIVREISWSRKYEELFYEIHHCFRVIMHLYYHDNLKRIPCQEFVKVQIVETQTQAVAAVTSLTSPHHTIRKVLKKVYSEVTIKKWYKGQNFFSHCK
jgi:hypothetical protein